MSDYPYKCDLCKEDAEVSEAGELKQMLCKKCYIKMVERTLNDKRQD